MRARGTLGGVAQLGVTIKPLTHPVRGALRYSPFKAGWTVTTDDLHRELHAHGAQVTVLEVDLRPSDFRQDGRPRGDRTAPWSAGVRLKFRATGVPGSPVLSFDSGEFDRWEDNVRALALGLEALRKADRYGITSGKQYAGFKALPPAGPDPERGRALVKRLGGAAAALRATHPDTRDPAEGYTDADFADVQAARGAS